MSRLARPRAPERPTAPPRATAPRTACLTAAVLLAAASPAAADTAGLRVDGRAGTDGPRTARIVVTTASGARRTLPPFVSAGVPGGLVASPDGRHLVVLPEEEDDDGVALLVPTDGGPARPLATPPGVHVEPPWSRVSWSVDSTAVIVAEAGSVVGPAGADAAALDAGDATVAWSTLRCPVATAACSALPGPAGDAVGVPGGTLVSSSALSTLPQAYVFAGAGDPPPPTWARPQSAWGRLVRAVHGVPLTTSTRLEGPVPRTLAHATRPAGQGLEFTMGLVGGPSGAVGYRYGFRTSIARRGGRLRLRTHEAGPRLLTVAPDGALAVRPVPRLRVTRSDLRVDRPRRPTSFRFLPLLGRADGGGWIGVADQDPDPARRYGTVLATMSPAGRARVVRIAGRAATAETVVRSARRPPRFDYLEGMTVAGYERATRSIVVTVGLGRFGRHGEPVEVPVTARVPVEGGRPVIDAGGSDAAW